MRSKAASQFLLEPKIMSQAKLVIEKGVHTFQYGHSRFRVPVLHIFTLPKPLLQPATCHSCFLAKTCGSRLHGMIHVGVHMSAYTYTLYNQIHSMLHRRHIFIHDSLNVYRYDCISTNQGNIYVSLQIQQPH